MAEVPRNMVIRPSNWSKNIFVDERIKPLQLGQRSLLRPLVTWHLENLWYKLPSKPVKWIERQADVCQFKIADVHVSGRITGRVSDLGIKEPCQAITNAYRTCVTNGYLRGIDVWGTKYGD